jgi:hypothetical protein
MRDERVVHDGATNGTHERNNLSCSFFCDHKSEPGRHLCDEAHELEFPVQILLGCCSIALSNGHTISDPTSNT